jgi:hypothetical protein
VLPEADIVVDDVSLVLVGVTPDSLSESPSLVVGDEVVGRVLVVEVAAEVVEVVEASVVASVVASPLSLPPPQPTTTVASAVPEVRVRTRRRA